MTEWCPPVTSTSVFVQSQKSTLIFGILKKRLSYPPLPDTQLVYEVSLLLYISLKINQSGLESCFPHWHQYFYPSNLKWSKKRPWAGEAKTSTTGLDFQCGKPPCVSIKRLCSVQSRPAEVVIDDMFPGLSSGFTWRGFSGYLQCLDFPQPVFPWSTEFRQLTDLRQFEISTDTENWRNILTAVS